MSSGLPALLQRQGLDESCRPASPQPACSMRGVLMKPGAIAFTVMLCGAELERERLGQADDAAFRRGVMHADAVAAAARGDRGEVDDAAELARLHARRELAADQERGGEVGRDAPRSTASRPRPRAQIAPGIGGSVSLRVGDGRAAGDVDQEIDRAGLRRRASRRRPRRSGRRPAMPSPGWMSVATTSTPSRLQPFDDGSTDAARRAGDQRPPPLQPLKRHTKRR